MDHDGARAALVGGRIGHLATVRADGRPHVVPCCYALVGDVLYSAVDAKPKRTRTLQRLVNVEANPRASLVVDHYDDGDWTQLWWVRVDGTATVVTDAAEALDALVSKYEQYESASPPGPVLALTIDRWRWWAASA
jgi:PPOX class probable F420-dependent enzyme